MRKVRIVQTVRQLTENQNYSQAAKSQSKRNLSTHGDELMKNSILNALRMNTKHINNVETGARQTCPLGNKTIPCSLTCLMSALCYVMHVAWVVIYSRSRYTVAYWNCITMAKESHAAGLHRLPSASFTTKFSAEILPHRHIWAGPISFTMFTKFQLAQSAF